MKATGCGPRRRRSFTLIELLVVIAIIGVLAGMVLGLSGYAMRRSGVARAEAEIAAMELALESFKADKGYYPRFTGTYGDAFSSTNVHKALVSGPKPYMTFKPKQLQISGTATNILDPFGTPYRYYCPGKNNPTGFDLWSYGPDKTNGVSAGTDHDLDNISNWKK